MMRFYSTKNPSAFFTLQEAALAGLAPDGGLFMPESIPRLMPAFFRDLPSLSLQEIAFKVSQLLLHGAIADADLRTIIEHSLTFDAPLVELAEDMYALELFHGPTLSFKDFGARFMAHLLGYLNRGQGRELHILAATSGDTGSAVAHGFLNIPGIKVWILYPKGQISLIQEQQITTVGHNVTALEVEGSFDDCQALVKQAFNDPLLNQIMRLTSANSINIARLVPQTFYYFYAVGQLKTPYEPLVIAVPSGNFGNLTAGLIAKRMGLPVDRFVAATNINDSVPKYLHTGRFQPHSSYHTLSNAMDVGNPSNFARILDLFSNDLEKIRRDIYGASFTDKQTQESILELYSNYRYVADPHGAVAYLGLKEYFQKFPSKSGIFLETAHPAKFLETVEPLIKVNIALPNSLQQALKHEKVTVSLRNGYPQLKALLAGR